jgi:toxin ParE1/3/4
MSGSRSGPRLRAHPSAGRLRDEIGEGYRSYRQGSHLIFDIVDGDIVAINGIPHGSMDIDAYFQSLG